MEGFTYYNMFDTKGMEYLIIIAFLILLIPFSYVLNKRVKLKRQLHKAVGILSSALLKIPQGVFFSRNHTWAHLAKSGEASVGLDDLLLHITGEININYLKNPGDSISRGEAMIELEHDGKTLQVYSPISGQVITTNVSLEDTPGQLMEDPYNHGWIYRIQPTDWKGETGAFFLAETATDWTKRELERFKDFLASAWPKYVPETSLVLMQDGGELRDHLLPELPEGFWRDFQSEFLTPGEH